MNNRYENINFDVFTIEPDIALTVREKRAVKSKFYSSTGKKRKKIKLKIVASIAACFVICMLITPIGSTAWAAIEVYLGVGTYVGMGVQDKYTTKLNIMKNIDDLEITLNEVIADDYELQCVITKENKDGDIPKINSFYVKINGEPVHKEENRSSGETGFGGLGNMSGVKQNTKTKKVGYYCLSTEHKMPLNPEIELTVEVDHGRKVVYNFTLENEEFIKDTKNIEINQELALDGKKVTLDRMEVTPISQKIHYSSEYDMSYLNTIKYFEKYEYMLYGEDNFGNKVKFSTFFEKKYFEGFRDANDDTWYLNPDVSWYKLQLYNLAGVNPDNWRDEMKAVGKELNIKI